MCVLLQVENTQQSGHHYRLFFSEFRSKGGRSGVTFSVCRGNTAGAAAAALPLLANEAKPSDHIVLSLHLPSPQSAPPHPSQTGPETLKHSATWWTQARCTADSQQLQSGSPEILSMSEKFRFTGISRHDKMQSSDADTLCDLPASAG